MYKISVEKYADATITVGNRRLFWVRMHDVQERLGVKNMSDLVRKEIHGIFETKNPTKDQIKRPEKNGLVLVFILMFVVILCEE